MLSIIIPNLNEEKNLPYFMESLSNQTARDFELIVIDGGSSDHSRNIIDKYRDQIPVTGIINETRNLGFVRNLGAKMARGSILLFTNSDAILHPETTLILKNKFKDSRLAAFSARTIPYEGGILCFLAYSAFDLLRAFFSRIHRFSPSGNFLAIRPEVFWKVGGFPLARVNEDGLLGSRLSSWARKNNHKLRFDLNLKAGHFAKRFKRNPLKTLMFYSYVFGNFSPFLKKILEPIELKSGKEFNRK